MANCSCIDLFVCGFSYLCMSFSSLSKLRLVGEYSLPLVICSFMFSFHLSYLFNLVMFINWVISHVLYIFG